MKLGSVGVSKNDLAWTRAQNGDLTIRRALGLRLAPGAAAGIFTFLIAAPFSSIWLASLYGIVAATLAYMRYTSALVEFDSHRRLVLLGKLKIPWTQLGEAQMAEHLKQEEPEGSFHALLAGSHLVHYYEVYLRGVDGNVLLLGEFTDKTKAEKLRDVVQSCMTQSISSRTLSNSNKASNINKP